MTCRIPIVVSAYCLCAAVLLATPPTARAESALDRREDFTVADHKAFVMMPPKSARVDGPTPWVWYAPTLGRGLPGGAERWMFDRLHAAGVAIAGIDVGESYGSPKGRAVYQSLYEHLTTQRGFGRKPVLLARSRGGLMLYNWAVEHPESVGGVAGIYPVCNVTSYPGVARAAPAFGLSPDGLQAKLKEHNPVDRLAPLAKAKVPIHHIHGDSDKVVPLEANSGLLAARYKALGGPVSVEVVKGQGHNMWSGWFESKKLTDFMISKAIGSTPIAAQTTGKQKPVKVYILSGQSNMVGIGQVTGGGSRWGDQFIDPVLSVYPVSSFPKFDYDKAKPIKTLKLEKFGGVHPTPYPGGGKQIVRGHIRVKKTGVYEFRPGYGGSTYNSMRVDGKEVYRREVGKDAVHKHIKLTAGKKVPFRLEYFNDQANGLGWIARIDIPGTLATVVKQDGKFPYLVDRQGNWVSRDDVWYKGVVTAGANKWLSVGCGAGANSIGPELGFGHMVGNLHDEPVLILKASQGNRSLAWDYLPPGSERYEVDGKVYAGYKDRAPSWDKGGEPKFVNWYAGKQYDDCCNAARQVLADFDKSFPHWKGRGYEIAGFAWWQGHKDQGNAVHAARYEQNLVHLINTLRKQFNAPDAPFVVATIGFGGWEMSGHALTVAKAQLAVDGDAGKYPKFKGNVKTVETRGFWKAAEVSPRNQGFHYNQNAETYMLVGEAMGKAMVELQKATDKQ